MLKRIYSDLAGRLGLHFHELIFLLVLLTLPFNLGKHYLYNGAYISGLLVDYLIPTLYVQDLLIIVVLGFWIFSRPKVTFVVGPAFGLLALILLAAGVATFFSINLVASLGAFLRIALYFLFGLYVFVNNFSPQKLKIFYAGLAFSVFLVCLLGLGQFFNQSSVFNNYLFFGEQPYSTNTFGIVKRDLFGQTVVPPYGTFRHPNTFAGFLSIFVLLSLFALRSLFLNKNQRLAVFVLIALSALLIFLTLTRVALLATVFSFLLWGFFSYAKVSLAAKNAVCGIFLAGLVSSVFLVPFFASHLFQTNHSFYRRYKLQTLAVQTISQNYWAGVGPANAAYSSASFAFELPEFKFPQPVHNIFLLIFVENGLVAFLASIFLIFYLMFLTDLFGKLVISHLLFLGLFDHYLLTMHQTLLISMLTLVIIMKYTLSRDKSYER